jgi:hypothetical protein
MKRREGRGYEEHDSKTKVQYMYYQEAGYEKHDGKTKVQYMYYQEAGYEEHDGKTKVSAGNRGDELDVC